MRIDRRTLLSVVAVGIAVLGRPAAAYAADEGPESVRSLGSPNAKTTVDEWFSLTCTHCSHFAQDTFPQIKTELIDTGKVRWVFRDFPLDQVALLAAMVARYLPPDRYEPFVMALFANQDRWAFAQGVNPQDELWKTAALAGMARATFDKAVADTALKTWILQQQGDAQKKWGIDSTPSFVINGQKYAGDMSFDAFQKLVASA
ncbi:MAG TPA: DsbA family protein [Acetobacteraceae bacterium]|jgi:protein-disulfide isomerase|nr:DsbA family protein [Acetobacteraceae bacterium]